MCRLLLLAAILAFAEPQQQVELSYTPGNEYIYEYETEILTGLPGGSKIYSGFKLRTDLKLQMESASRVAVQMEKLTLMKINDPIESVNPTRKPVPDSAFRIITEPETKKMAEDLEKPFKFKYIRGEISDIESERDDPEWSMNIKRGILSLFQINLDERMSTNDISRPPPSRRMPNDLYRFYTVMEPSVSGECETMYKVLSERMTDGSPSLFVTKVRNFDKCLDRPVLTRTMFRGFKCAQCESDKLEPLKAGTEIRYQLRGDSRQNMIQSVVAESEYYFTLYSDEGGHVATFVNQTLYLKKSETTQQPISSPRQHRRPRLQLVPKVREVNRETTPLSSSRPQPLTSQEQDRIKQKIRKLFKVLLEYSNGYVREEAGPTLLMLVEEMKRSDTPVLRDLYTYIKSLPPPERPIIKKAYFDLLPATGTAAASEILLTLLDQGDMTPSEAALSMNILAVTARPDVYNAQKLFDFVKHRETLGHRELKRSVFLCIGAVASRMKEESRKLSKQLEKQKRLVQKVLVSETQTPSQQELRSKLVKIDDEKQRVQTIFSKIRIEIIKEIQNLLKSTNRDDKLIALKTMGNSGFEELLNDARAILYDRSQPQLFRTQAIYSLRKLARESPEQVRSILLPMFFDPTEREEIRVGSYLVVMGTNPPRYTLEMIAKYLRRESNPHVGTFVYSYLEQLSNSTHPCLLSWAKNATYALQFARKYSPSFHYSRFLQYDTYDERTQLGGALEIGYISSPEEFIPRSGAAHLNMHFLGSSFNIGEIGYNTEGLQKLTSKLVGPDGLLTKGKSLVDVLKERHTRSVPSSPKPDEVSETHRQLNVSPRDSPDPEGHIYLKMFGNELRYFQLDSNTVLDLFLKGSVKTGTTEEELKAGRHFDLQRSWLFTDALHMVVTEAGFPLNLKLRGGLMTKMTGTFTTKGTPSLFQSRRPGQKATELEVQLDFHPSIVFDARGEMEMDAGYYQTGASVKLMTQSDSPMSMNFATDLPKAKLFTKINMEKLKEKLLKMEILPLTFIKRDPIAISEYPTVPENKEITAADGAIVFPVSRTFGTNTVGMTFELRGQRVLRNFLRGIPYCPLNGKQLVHLTTSPGPKPQKYAEIQLQMLLPHSHRSRTPSPSSSSSTLSSDSSKSGGVLSWLGDLFGSSDDSSQSLPDPASQPVIKDLRNSDSSIPELEQKLKKNLPDNREYNYKTGLVMSIMGVEDNRNSERKAQLMFLYECPKNNEGPTLYFRINRTPIPDVEKEPWKMDMKIDMTYPTETDDPSQILQSTHQRKVQHEINLYVEQDGKEQLKNRVKDILPRGQLIWIEKVLSESNSRSVLDEVMRDEIEKLKTSQDIEIKSLESILRKQRRIIKEAKEITRESITSIKIKQCKDKLEKVLIRAGDVLREIRQKSISLGRKTPKDLPKTLLKYSVLKQQLIKKSLQKASKALLARLTSSEKSSLQRKLTSNKHSLDSILKLQSQTLNSRSGLDIVRDVRSRNPSQERLSRSLHQLSVKQDQVIQHMASSQQPNDVLGIDKSQVQEVVDKAKDVIKEIYELPSSSSSLDKEVEKQVKEVSVQQQQVIRSLKDKIGDSRTDTQQRRTQKRELRKQAEQLRDQANTLSKVIGQLVYQRTEQDALKDKLQQEERKILKKLQKMEIQQILALRRIVPPKPSKDEDVNSDTERIERIEKSMQVSEEVNKALDILIKNVPSIKPQLLIKIVKVAHVQSELLDRVLRKARDEGIRKVAKTSRPDDRLERLKKKSEIEKLRQISIQKSLLSKLKDNGRLSSKELDTKEEIEQDVKEIRREQRQQEKEIEILRDSPPQQKPKVVEKLSRTILKLKDIKNRLSRTQRKIESSRLHRKSKDLIQDLKIATKKQEQVLNKARKAVKTAVTDVPSQKQLNQRIASQVQSLDRLRSDQRRLENEVIPNDSNIGQNPADSSKTVGQNQVSHSKVSSVHPMSNQVQSSVQRPQSKTKSPRQLHSSNTSDTSVQDSIRQSKQIKRPVDDTPFKMTFDIEFGNEGDSPKKIFIEMIGKKSLEQLLWESDQASPLLRDRRTKRYLDETEDGEEELKKSYKQLKKELNLYRHFHANIRYDRHEMPRFVFRTMWDLRDEMKCRLFDHLEKDWPEPGYRNDRIEFLMVFKKNNRQVDLSLKTYEEIDRFYSVNLPYYLDLYLESMDMSRNESPSKLQASLKQITKKLPGTCEVKRSLLKSLDDRVYRLPDIGACDVLLAMDCSSSKQFSIKSRKDPTSPEKKIIKISIENRKVEIVPDRQSVRVKVDGQSQPVRKGSPVIIRETRPQGQHAPIILEIERKGSNVRVDATRKGIQVRSDGVKVDIKVSPFFYSRMCGLCGNYDGKPDNDFETADRDMHTDPKCFVMSYIMSNQQCRADDVKRDCQHLPQSANSGICSPKIETLKRTRLHNNISQICFSKKPIKRCEQGCKPRDQKSIPVQMHCVRKTDPEAIRLERESYSRVLSELASKSVDYTDYIQEPGRCRDL